MKLINTCLLYFLIIPFCFSQQQSPIDYFSDNRNKKVIPTDEATVVEGEQLFHNHCRSCHSLCQQQMGPALASVTDRRPVSWLLDFIHSSQTVIQNGDPYANFLYEEYNGMIMPDFQFLSDEEIMTLLAYIKNASSVPTGMAGVNSNSQPLRDLSDSGHPEELPLESRVSGIEYEEGGQQETKYFIMKIVFFGVALLSVVAHLVFVGLLWRRGKTRFKM